MSGRTAPFSRFEFMIAWRYIRAKRAEGGVSVMTWISLIGVTLAVFALVATLAIRSGFRSDLVATIVGSTAHVAVQQDRIEEIPVTQGDQTVIVTRRVQTIGDYDAWADQLAAVPGVVRADPVVVGQGLLSNGNNQTFVDANGISAEDIRGIPLVREPMSSAGSLDDFGRVEGGIAIGSGVARAIGATVGTRVTLLSATGVQTVAGRAPRRGTFDVVYIFQTGRYVTDQSRIYLPLAAAQDFFNRTDQVDRIELFVEDPDVVETNLPAIMGQMRDGAWVSTWKDFAGSYLRALTVEDNVMFILLSILVLIASMNIISGLVMLVKNKGRDIGILRTMGLTEGSVLRVFFICGAGIGTLGTVLGVVLGCLFVIYIDPIFSFVNWIGGGGVWDPSIRGIYELPAELRAWDVVKASTLSLALSWIVTIFPARRAARLNPVEALRYE